MSIPPKKEKYSIPEGASAGLWFIVTEGGKFTVKRMLTLADGSRTNQRAARSDWTKHSTAYSEKEVDFFARNPGSKVGPPKALVDCVIRMNGKDPEAERIKAQIQYEHAWIDDAFLQSYKEDILYKSMQDRSNADTLFNYLNRYGLNWFLRRKKALTVESWKHYEKEWGKYLLNMSEDQDSMVDRLRLFENNADDPNLRPRTRQLSAKVLKYVLFEMNRFIRYIYVKRRSEFDDELVILDPWGPAFLSGYASNWRVKNQPRLSKYVPPEHWKIISEAMLKQQIIWRHEVHLAVDYGLRRRETLGLAELSVKPEFLHLQQQLKKASTVDGRQVRTFQGLKGKEMERKIPHWFVPDAKVTRARIRSMLSQDIPHPDTISRGFNQFCKSLADDKDITRGYDYIFHDLRRTFITNAVKKGIAVEDLIFATGHKNEQVLRKFYLMDYRELESDFDLGEDDEDIVV